MTAQRRRGFSGLGLAALAALALGVAACGGSSSDNSKSSSSGSSSSSGAGKKGGTIAIEQHSFPDFLDPALSFTVDGVYTLHLVYPGLVTFPGKPGVAGATVVPGLAESLPQISSDGKTYTFQLRKGLRFSDGTSLKAGDFKASIERVLKQDSEGAGLGYINIVGGEQYLKTKKGGITGIQADDATGKIVIHLVKPRGAFLYELALTFAGVVPRSTPAKNLTQDPPPGAGMYKYVKVAVNRSYQLVRNKNFSPALKGTAVDIGNPDGFNVAIEKNLDNSVTKVSQGGADFMVDNPPSGRIAELKQRYGPGASPSNQRWDQFATNSTFYMFMNTETKPFDNLKVRQAINYAIDPEAINRIQGGVLAPANTILPPGVPGHKSWPNLYPHNMAKAKALIKQAGATGAPVTVWADDKPPTPQTMEYYTNLLNQIGLKAKIKIIAAATYFTTIGDRKLKAQTGWADWFQDYPHPADFVDVLLNPDKVVDTGNNNFSYNATDHKLAAEINALAAEPVLTPAVATRWANVDRQAQEKAYWGIYGNRKQTTFMSTKLNFQNCKGEHSVWTTDFAEFCLK